MKPTILGMWISAALACTAIPTARGQFSIDPHADSIDVMYRGELFTTYRFRSESKPVLWPILGPDNRSMTRSYPIDPSVDGEAHDHPHHRGLWMTFGEVDGSDWWAEGTGKGTVVHRRVRQAQADGSAAVIVAEHEWVAPAVTDAEPKVVLQEVCRYAFHGDDDSRIIDCEYLLSSPDPEATVRFGDTKEGMFAIRVPEAMRGDRPGGELLNSQGDRGGDVWGKSAKWVDYSGPARAGETGVYGIAILIHPASFRAEGLWHARTYGLFAHNPFGIQDFLPHRTPTESGRLQAPHSGGYVLPAKESLHFIYRVILHRDRWSLDQGNARWEEFSHVAPNLR